MNYLGGNIANQKGPGDTPSGQIDVTIAIREGIETGGLNNGRLNFNVESHKIDRVNSEHQYLAIKKVLGG